MPYIGNVTTSSNVNGSQINNGTITGDKLSLPFDYDSATLYLDNTNNRVGILTASPSSTLTVGTGGVVSIPLASAATPSLVFGTDTNTGIYSPGADQLAISTAGSGRLFVDSSGNAGVNASSPTEKLNVVGNISLGVDAIVNDGIFAIRGGSKLSGNPASNATQLTIAGGDAEINAAAGSTGGGSLILRGGNASKVAASNGLAGDVFIKGGTVTTNGFGGSLNPGKIVFETNANERLRITSAGLVGIGTSSPSTTLSVAGGISGTAGANISGAGWGVLPYVANSLVIDNNAGEARFFATGANATTRGSFIFYNGETDGGAGAAMVIDSSSRVGIGTTSPQYKLVVSNNEAEGIEFRPGSASNVTQTLYYNRTSSVYTQNLSVANTHVFAIDSAVIGAAVTIDSSKRLLVGTSTARAIGGVTPRYFQEGSSTYESLGLCTNDNSFAARGSYLLFARSRGTTAGSNTIVQSGDFLGGIGFAGADGSDLESLAGSISCEVDGTPGANDMPGRLVFSTTADGASSPTERMRIDSSGDLIKAGGVIKGERGTAAAPAYSFSDDTDTGIFNISNADLGFSVGGTERARIDSSGRLLVGTSSSAGSARLVVGPSVGDTPGYVLVARSTNPSGGDGYIGVIGFSDNDHTKQSAQIRADFSGGTWSASSKPSDLVFSTTADGASSPTERMRITNNGETYFGITGNTGLGTTNRGFLIRNEIVGKTYVQLASTGTTTDTVFYFYNGNGLVGSISMNGSATSYNTSSDYRLKENVTPVSDGITRLQQLKPSRFNFIADPDTVVDGFLAHEAQAAVPECVTGTKDEVDDDGNPVYQGIDQSKLVPLLTAALQEAIGEIESLKARVAALESA